MDKVLEAEKEETKLREGVDTALMDIWDVVCEIGVAVTGGDTFNGEIIEN